MSPTPQTSQRVYGIVLIVTSVLAALAIMHHPHGAGPGSSHAHALLHIARLNALVHGAVMLSLVVTWLALAEYARPRLTHSTCALSGILLFTLSTLSMLGAGLINGFVITRFAADTLVAGLEHDAATNAVFRLCWAFNQGLAGLGLLSQAAAVVCWSIDQLRTPGLMRGVGLYGVSISLLIAIGFLSDWFSLDVRGMVILVLGFGAWYVGVGLRMLRPQPN